ncbi:hypothetical protein BH760_gp75 [Gordonia phage Splinter]|uniref:Uncharacterized protein n=2 Tax=Vendettavirus vendetta TaxID=2049886 RepID=A0A161HSZ0_9CAUD|nr:hypothetical protein BH795_gp75 [Gordonia phage Vendetta]YP_009275390.1 hypothetical protein BH760_gp75 [Gordonia phage Splinter]ANA85583.1 hypothetical protein PBI_VENDETTA_36 [Gordonia phage Vendetta]ANA85662.1 hypothetical protein PBI_SPLINTER_36 [Gordonia phage Splinter]
MLMTNEERATMAEQRNAERFAEWEAGGRRVRLGMARTVHVWGKGATECGRKPRPGQQRRTLDPVECKRCAKAA